MKLFVSGDQEENFIIDTLEELDDDFGIEEICGSAVSKCMDVIVPWAEYRNIPISLHLPLDFKKQTLMLCNLEILQLEKPNVLFIYEEDEEIQTHLIANAKETNSSVEYIIKERP